MWEGAKEESKRTATDGGDEGCAFISCKSTKITTSYWMTIDRRMLELTKKNIPYIQRQRSYSKMVGGTYIWWSQIPYPPGEWPANWRTIIPKKFSHCFESSVPHVRLPSLGTQQRVWESPGNLTLKASRIWLQDFHRTGGNRDSSLGGHNKTMHTPRPRGKE